MHEAHGENTSRTICLPLTTQNLDLKSVSVSLTDALAHDIDVTPVDREASELIIPGYRIAGKRAEYGRGTLYSLLPHLNMPLSSSKRSEE